MQNPIRWLLNKYDVLAGKAIRLFDTTNTKSSTIQQNGADLEITNITALGDNQYEATVEHRFQVNTDPRFRMDATTVYFDNSPIINIEDVNTGNYYQMYTNASGLNIFSTLTGKGVLIGTSGNTYLHMNAGVGLQQFVNGGGTKFVVSSTYVYLQEATAMRGGEAFSLFDSTNNDVTGTWQMPALLTADAVQTTMQTVTLDDNHWYTIQVHVTAMKTDASDGRGFIKSAVFKRDGAGAVQIGATVSTMSEGSAAALLDFTVNGNDVRVSVTGPAVENWNWTGKIQVTEVD